MAKSVRQKKGRDEREWTTPEQKEYLLSKQPGYAATKRGKERKAWFTIEMKKYFERFPTQEVTENETLLNGSKWSYRDKREMEEKVSQW
jgi:hypothetical protein